MTHIVNNVVSVLHTFTVTHFHCCHVDTIKVGN